MSITEDATITSKGQVTIPKRVRDTFGLEEGEEIQFVITETGDLTIRHKRDPMEQLREVREQLAPHAIDVADLRKQAKTEWSAVNSQETE